jgi:hypothetical protein
MLRAVLPFLTGVGISQILPWAWERWKRSRYERFLDASDGKRNSGSERHS